MWCVSVVDVRIGVVWLFVGRFVVVFGFLLGVLLGVG